MFGTHSATRPFVAFISLALIAVALALVWGCNRSPVSIPGSDTASFSQMSRPDGRAETVGTVDAIDPAALRLRVGALWFRADLETEIEIDRCESGCGFGDIAVGDAVKVKHDSAPDATGDYTAREIEVENEDEFEEADPDDTETEGTVAAVDGAGFEVDGIWFWTDAATAIELDECAQLPLAIGDAVKVEHTTQHTAGLGFYAFKVEVTRECAGEESATAFERR